MRDQELNEKHATNPMPGDYWHEMFTPIAVVLDVVGDTVVFCRNTESSGTNHWRWNHKLSERLPKATFAHLFRYETMPDKFHADVVPQGHLSDADAYRSASSNGSRG